MDPTRCADCYAPMDAWNSVLYGSLETGYRLLCARCRNAQGAKAVGLAGFEHLHFEPITMDDADGRPHEFHFRANLFGPGIALDALELRDGQPDGYRFRVIGDPEGDQMALLAILVAKMRRALARRHIVDTQHGPQVADAAVVRGTVESDLGKDDGQPSVVIDGRQLSWSDLGRMVRAYEGWQFRLEFLELSDES